MRPLTPLIVVALLGPALIAPVAAQEPLERSQVRMWLPAVGQRADGTLFGVASSLEVTMQTPGNGQVFLSTKPHTEIDMQGSARLAVATASSTVGVPASNKDFFFSVETEAVTVGGPSGGGAMAVAVLALLKGWSVRDDVIMTGMIDPDGSIGPIGGILQKVEAADSVGADTFLIPLGQGKQTVQNAQTGRTETIDVSDYARQNFGIDVVEVGDLFDAVEPFTGHRLIRPEPTKDPLQDAAYADITRRLATNLTDTAQTRLSSLETRYAAERTEIGAADRQDIEAQLQDARTRLAAARDAQNRSRQYLAASLAFQALVDLGYADAVLTFHEGDTGNAGAFLNTYLAETDRQLAAIGDAIQATYPIAASRLDAQGAAEQRLLEALDTQQDARQARNQGRLSDSLRSSSFARERGESSRWWHQIGLDVADGAATIQVTEAALGLLTAQYAETAQLQLQYAALIAPQATAYQAAEAALASAQAALDQNLDAAALFELVEVFAQTNTALVSIAGVEPVEQRLGVLEDAAAYQIELAQGEGVPPVYAISLLELAQSRAATDPVGAYAAFSAARISARTTLQAAGIQAPPPRDETVRPGLLTQLTGSWWLVGYVLASGVLVLVLAGWLLRAPRAQAPPPPPEPESSPPAPGAVLIAPPPAEPFPLLPAPPPPPPATLPDDATGQPKPAPKRRPPRRAPTTTRRPRRPKPDREPDPGKA